jgi:stringent starvation protein B
MNSTRPYLIRAFYEWIVDSDCTPHIVVNAEAKDVMVPREFVEGGQIVLNISMPAVQNLALNNEAVSFQARFGGVAHDVYVPVTAVMAIYARENGRGMVFSEEEETTSGKDHDTSTNSTGGKTGGTSDKKGKGGKGKAHLTVIK